MFRGVILAVISEQETKDRFAQALSLYQDDLLIVGGVAPAIAALDERRIAVLVLDRPFFETQDASVLCRARQTCPQASIIGLLAKDESLPPEWQVLGMDDFLQKPLSPDLLRLAVARSLELGRLKREAERLALVNEVGRQITFILDMNKLLWQVARLIRESFDFYYVGIALLEGDAVEVKAAVGGQDDYLPVGVSYRLKDSEEMMVQALVRQEPLLLADIQNAISPELSEARSALVIPIAFQDQQLGALEVLSVEARAFEPADLPLFESLAAQIAIAVQNAKLFAARQKHEETLHSLNAAAVAMQRAITSQTKVLEVMSSELSRSGFISLVHLQDQDSASVNLIHSSLSSRLSKALTELLDVPPDDWSLDLDRAPTFRQVREECRAIFCEHVESLIDQIVPLTLLPDKLDLITRILGYPSAVVAPMLLEDQVVGWLTVFSAQLTAEHRPAIMAFANQAAVALGNARLLVSARRADDLALINQVGQAMAATLEFDEVLRLLLQAVTEVVGGQECAVALWSDEAQRHVSQARLAGGRLSLLDLVSEDSLPPLRIPLLGREQKFGLLALDQHSTGKELSAENLPLIKALANQAAGALESARLYGELKQSAEDLEHSQRRLVQSAKLIATGRLAASIAHEINNPLQAIKNCLELIIDEVEAGEPLDRTLLDVAAGELERIRRIIQQMLDLYRPRQERMEPVDLNAAVEGVLALMRKQLESHNVTVETHLDSAAPQVIGREDQLRQVFINLVLNAIEAMPQGGQITIKTNRQDGLIAVQVSDTGVGIAPENLTRIADPFFSTKPKGVGLGLTICHEIIERHRGTLDVRSQVGRGSRFIIQLPAAD